MFLLNCAASPQQTRFQILETVLVEMTAQHNDEFAPLRQLVRMLTKQLAKDPLAVVTLDGVAHTTAGDDTETRCGCNILGYVALENKRSAVDALTQTADSLKFAWFAQTH